MDSGQPLAKKSGGFTLFPICMPGQGRGKLLDLHLRLLMRAPECLHGHGDENHAGPPALLRLSSINKGSGAFSNQLVAYRAGNLTLVVQIQLMGLERSKGLEMVVHVMDEKPLSSHHHYES